MDMEKLLKDHQNRLPSFASPNYGTFFLLTSLKIAALFHQKAFLDLI